MRKNVTRKQQLQNSKRRNALVASIVFIVVVVALVALEAFEKKSANNDREEESVVLTAGIGNVFENADWENIDIYEAFGKATKTDIDLDVVQMAQTEETTEATTERTTEAVTEATTEETTEATTESPTESYYSEEDLYWLSHVIAAEVGDSTYESKAMCGLVVMNRVNSVSFKANTIEDVLFSPGQYATVRSGRIYNEPDEESVEVARKILSGTIEIQIPENVVYQAMFPQGSGIYRKIGSEYYCYDDEY